MVEQNILIHNIKDDYKMLSHHYLTHIYNIVKENKELLILTYMTPDSCHDAPRARFDHYGPRVLPHLKHVIYIMSEKTQKIHLIGEFLYMIVLNHSFHKTIYQ